MASVRLLNAVIATTTAPSVVGDGTSIADINYVNAGLIVAKSTAGSGVMTITVRLWGWSPAAAAWLPLGTGAAGTKGQINAVSTLDETGADSIAHAEVISNYSTFSHLNAQVTAIGGTATAVSLWIEVR